MITSAQAFESSFEQLPESSERAHPQCKMSIFVVSAAGWRRFFFSVMVALEPHDQRRHERARQKIGGRDGEHDRLGQWDEEITRHPRKKKHWHEHYADAERRYECRERDFASSLENCVFQFLPQAHVTLDIFDGHGCVIDEDADGQS